LFTKKIGDWGEKIALRFLLSKKWRLVASNWRCHQVGEIDLIMESIGRLIFVEVKTRTGEDFGAGIDFVDDNKIDKLTAAAEEFLLQNPRYQNYSWRLDAIEIKLMRSRRRAVVCWYKNIS
jgi:putative endonuclease